MGVSYEVPITVLVVGYGVNATTVYGVVELIGDRLLAQGQTAPEPVQQDKQASNKTLLSLCVFI